MKSALLTSTPLAAAISWTIALVVDPGSFEQASVLLVGLGLLSMASVAVVGVVVSGGRWARNLALTAVVAGIVLAIVRPIDFLWFVSIGLSAVALVAMFAPSVTQRLRKLPSASGPPTRAVLTPSILLTVPYLIGLTSIDGSAWAMIVVGVAGLLSAFLYARVVLGGLVAVRVAWPSVALGLAPFLGARGGATSVVMGLVVAVVAWHPSVKAAFYPPSESGTSYPIPPELAPQEILDAAQIDDRGNPK